MVEKFAAQVSAEAEVDDSYVLRGNVEAFSLLEIVQLISSSRQSFHVTIHRSRDEGHLYFKKGQLIDAQYKNMTGYEAAWAILIWKKGIFIAKMEEVERDRHIEDSPQSVILEALRRTDEQKYEETTFEEELAKLDDSLVDVDIDQLANPKQNESNEKRSPKQNPKSDDSDDE